MSSMNKSAIVTGASSGIGRATAIMLGKNGYAVTLVGRREEPLRETARAIGEKRCLVVAGDVGEGAGAFVRRMIDGHVERFGRLDLLVNNAGLAPVLSVEETTPGTLEEVVRVNALAVGWAIHAAWPIFRRQFEHERSAAGNGCIVNVSSMASIDPFPGLFAYGAAKAAVNLLTVSAAKEGQKIGVRVFSLAPGAVETPMLRAGFDETVAPPETCLSPEDVAKAILACAEGARDADNGKTIPVLSGPAKEWYAEWRTQNPLGWLTEPA